MKRHAIILMFIGMIVLLCSCQKKLPDGDIKDFVNLLTYERAYEETFIGKSESTTSHYVDGVLEGSIHSTTFFDIKNEYYYEKMVVYGSYYGSLEDQFDYYSKELVCYKDQEAFIYKENKDAEKKNEASNEEALSQFIQGFFYKDFSASYHSGGMYYGDYILLNVAKYYSQFTLSADKKELSFSVNTSAKNDKQGEVITMHSFTVNENGMLLRLETKSFFAKDVDTYMLTKVDCQYDEKSFDKIWNI